MKYVEFDIIDVAQKCGIEIHKRSEGRVEVKAKCPFCNDRHYPLSFNTVKQRFRCNRCNTCGNAVTLYAWRYGLNNKDAAEELIKQRTPSDCSGAYEDSKPECRLADLQTRHNVYYDFLNMLELTDGHRKNLCDRGLSDGYIDRFMYKSMPLNASFRRIVVNSLADKYDLRGIPGFFTDDYNNWNMFVKPEGGVFIPVCNSQGYIQGLQIRLDNETKQKYRWFSSHYFKEGTGATSWIHTVGDVTSPTACITEGALKADVASILSGGKLFIAIPGVHCIDKLPGVLNALKIEKVVESYDMDKFSNPHVSEALVKLKSLIHGLGIEYVPFKWNPEYKGIDDYLHHRNMAREYACERLAA